MRSLILTLGLLGGVGLASAHAGNSSAPLVTLGRPQPVRPATAAAPAGALVPVAMIARPRPVIRGQSPEFPPMNVPPPPPPPGGFSGPATFPGGPAATPGSAEAYNCGVVTNDADLGGFWSRVGDHFSRGWSDLTGSVTGISTRATFQSDHEFDVFISPVSNPVYFEDPRALTELRPVFIWQRTRDDTPYFGGGDNFFATLQGRVAFTPWLSLVVNKVGWSWIQGDDPIFKLPDGNGLSEVHVGPKVTIIRNENSNTIAALGLNFELGVGSSKVLQDTGTLSLSPYFSFAQNFFRTSYGSFNFMNTTGVSFGIDSERTDFVYVSGHLDFDVGNLKKFYPLVEVNWTRYLFNGNARSFNFEGNNLFNFGSRSVAGQDDLTLALGFRYLLSQSIQFGLAAEASLIGGGRHMDRYRVTADMIFRY